LQARLGEIIWGFFPARLAPPKGLRRLKTQARTALLAQPGKSVTQAISSAVLDGCVEGQPCSASSPGSNPAIHRRVPRCCAALRCQFVVNQVSRSQAIGPAARILQQLSLDADTALQQTRLYSTVHPAQPLPFLGQRGGLLRCHTGILWYSALAARKVCYLGLKK
jgi:hypothetical protein